ncbi:hypothetical protein NEOLI_005276 [Neolecta irregularis DAH-3]|uniref:Mtf2-like C-terminal domain-containing protein n=1 Tax=Neolecta irregularis (strain DAH-3) TaxID=1198029 RepID=A0A1U7LLC2_NEOID|nr:hypothetical protein NEOLI_005276 [Neolecta irregularis DAH-3]|eukprot:OLL23342.1 hypothetical protein NEOLI_005276 [Neolecta irregularis DAH-3]
MIAATCRPRARLLIVCGHRHSLWPRFDVGLQIRKQGSWARQDTKYENEEDWDYLFSSGTSSSAGREEPPEELLRVMDDNTLYSESFGQMLKPPRSEAPPKGTMTQGEQQVFGRIFESILADRTQKDAQTATPPLFYTPAAGGNSLMSQVSEYPEALRTAAMRTFNALQAEMPSTAEEAELFKGRDKLVSHTLHALKHARSDAEVLEVFMQNVYGPSKRELQGHTKIRRTAFVTAFPGMLGAIMRTMRVAYVDPAASITMFERIKGAGIEAYVAGCSVEVYNEALRARWEGWRDVQGLGELVDEMQTNSVFGNGETAAILREVRIAVDTMKGAVWAAEDFDTLDQLDTYRRRILNREERQCAANVREERQYGKG